MGEPGGSVGIGEQSALLNSRGSGKIHVEPPNTPLVAAVRQALSHELRRALDSLECTLRSGVDVWKGLSRPLSGWMYGRVLPPHFRTSSHPNPHEAEGRLTK
jgi:hypothetical protein